MQSFELKFSGVTFLQGVEFPIFLLILEWALQQCSANALPVINLTCVVFVNVLSSKKSAQRNLGRGSRRGTVAHVRRKVPIGYNGAPQIRPQKYPFPWTDPQTPLPESSLAASGSDTPFFHNALDRSTDAQTDRSSTGKFDHCSRCATRATRPNYDFTCNNKRC